ncbi:hypothetical protein [Brevibacillus laterosporus]|uniref:hypothetical protein n=1 Tax=Brevibacillus laterosporus TaxID=1465 RepID=UPI000E6BDB22|nr:hypothetical protein [Brevibacillus laterosporus]AYB38467.1 hypothetical protein D5F52_09455 [Brevibacillus laterosporus]MBM7111099.1 hypothetical protein [Brevibacillus laterosporus]NKQ18493.1 hypothetical protein [Brevibacillus laterosporus]WNX33266.1 hypothetical protein RWW94_10915 [Brevibacillus laterosporus]
MQVEFGWLHGIYVLFILFIILLMVLRRDTSLVSIVGIAVLGFVASGSMYTAVEGIFNSFIYAINELLPTILIICVIVGMSLVLSASGVNETMITPMTFFIKAPGPAYWIIGISMMVISWFFWPSPAVALIGAVVLPVAVRIGLPAIGVAIAMNLFGHGIALSSDFIIQGAPSLTAGAAGIAVEDVIRASVPLIMVMGLVSTSVAFYLLRRDMKNGKLQVDPDLLPNKTFVEENGDIGTVIKKDGTTNTSSLSKPFRIFFSILVPLLFALDVLAMWLFNLRGGDATSLIGGTAMSITLLVTLFTHKNRGLEKTTEYLIQGFQFGFRVFGPVIPIAAFFYMGDSGFTKVFGEILPAGSQGIVNDLGVALAQMIPLTKELAAATVMGVGIITGLDGSGFSGITLAGSVSHLFASSMYDGVATLTALGQVAAIWVGGGTLVPWALIPAAAICGVSPFELARRNLIPVLIGLVVTTIVAVFLL